MEMNEALNIITREMGRPVISTGYEERVFWTNDGDAIVVNNLYYRADYKEGNIEWTDIRMSTFVNGKPQGGTILAQI